MINDAAMKTGVQRTSGSAQWYMVAVLTLLVILSYIDRTVLSLLVGPIKADLGLTDTQISYLLGLSFALFYGVVSVPAGYLVDRFPRGKLLFGAILLWTTMTLLSGFASTFMLLLICRSGVGFGEAALSPGAYSLISDEFDGPARSKAFTLFSLGNAIGGGVSLVIVSGLLHWLNGNPFEHFEILSGAKPWQLVLIILGIAGLPLSFLVLTFREPKRKSKNQNPTFSAALAQFKALRSVYVPLYTANFFIGIALFGFFAWGPATIGRVWELQPSRVGSVYGSVQIVASLIGLGATGLILDRLTRVKNYRGVLIAGGSALLLGSVALAVFPHMPTQSLSWIALGIVMMALPCAPVVTAVILTQVTPGRMTGKFSALTFLIVSAFGTAIGPTLIAVISDKLFTGRTALGFGLSLGAGIPLCMSALLLLRLSYGARHELAPDGL